MTTREELMAIDRHDHIRQEMLVGELGKLGITLRIQHFSGANSYPTEYTLITPSFSVVEPTFDMALLTLIATLLKEQ